MNARAHVGLIYADNNTFFIRSCRRPQFEGDLLDCKAKRATVSQIMYHDGQTLFYYKGKLKVRGNHVKAPMKAAQLLLIAALALWFGNMLVDVFAG